MEDLASWVTEARSRTLDLFSDLSDDHLLGPRLAIVNPPLWELGHVAWFQERWVLRTARGQGPLRPDGDALYDSAAIPHDVRWDLPLPSRSATIDYLRVVRDRVLQPSDGDEYFVKLSVFHEDMHDEAFTYTRQTHGLAAPRFTRPAAPFDRDLVEVGRLEGDAAIPGGAFVLGAEPGGADDFVFDNEKWGHEVAVRPFCIARAQVSRGEFLTFVRDRGYARPELWSEAGRRWLEDTRSEGPLYWRRDADGRWLERRFDRWEPIELAPHRAMIHVCAYEAEAYAAWAGRRLPTELEWEVAAAGEPDDAGRRLARRKRRFPWGDAPPGPEHANLEWRAMGTIDTAALPGGDSAFGVRQLIGNVWEWTSTDFQPYPGFTPDPYEEYSAPWFGTHRVLRGGAWATRGRLLRNTWRNFYPPHRRDVLAGFRTCAR